MAEEKKTRRRDLYRYVKWPKNVRVQRQRAILKKRLKVPPQIAQFDHTLKKDKFQALIGLLRKYKPETRKEKYARLRQQAKAEKAGNPVQQEKPNVLTFGMNDVCRLVEKQKAKLVVIAANVHPIETIVWLPNLCRKKDIPYCIVKDVGILGQLVNMKRCTCVAVTDVNGADAQAFNDLVEAIRPLYNGTTFNRWGGALKPKKTRDRLRMRKINA